VDRLLRAEPGQSTAAITAVPGGADSARAELQRLWTASFRDSAGLSGDDRTYVARVVAARTGLSQADAERRVDQVVEDAKAAADKARKAAANSHCGRRLRCCSVPSRQASPRLRAGCCGTAPGTGACLRHGRSETTRTRRRTSWVAEFCSGC
jgi:hypothetical protein